jgi:hypothetical protein
MSIVEKTLEILPLISAVAVGLKWVLDYSENKKWEKNKFLLERFEEFETLDSTKKVHRMLDWNKCKIDDEFITDEILISALETHNNKNKFTPLESKIRGLFDEYLDNLNKLIVLSETGLIDGKNLRKFMKYWFEILNGSKKNKPREFNEKLTNYMEYYDFGGILDFVRN